MKVNPLKRAWEIIEVNSEIPVVVIREPGRSALYLLVKESIYIGRGGSGVLLDDPQVSRQHLELIPEENKLSVRDCGSSHGTFHNGTVIKGIAELDFGSTVRIGNVTIERYKNHETPGKPIAECSANQDLQFTSIQRVADLVLPDEAASISKPQSEHTLTIVFSDIEGSTKLTVGAGDKRWYEIISSHNKLIRDTASLFDGTVVKSNGDGFMLTFLSARSAVDAFVKVQEVLETLDSSDVLKDIRIRVGIHVGEAIAGDDGDYYGRHVNTAARIADKATGGEILVSNLVKEIIDARGDIDFGESRVVSLKGISEHYVVHPINRR